MVSPSFVPLPDHPRRELNTFPELLSALHSVDCAQIEYCDRKCTKTCLASRKTCFGGCFRSYDSKSGREVRNTRARVIFNSHTLAKIRIFLLLGLVSWNFTADYRVKNDLIVSLSNNINYQSQIEKLICQYHFRIFVVL